MNVNDLEYKKLPADWKRREHFEFFKNYDEPFFGITVNVDCTRAYKRAKRDNVSFFLFYLHRALEAANMVEAFRYRLVDQEAVVYNKVNVSVTIGREDNTFGFTFIQYDEDFEVFARDAERKIEKARRTSGLMLEEASKSAALIQCSALPWFSFTSFSHARNYSTDDSVPKICFGRMFEEGEKKKMPVSVHVHHALADGYHVGRYFEKLQDLLNK